MSAHNVLNVINTEVVYEIIEILNVEKNQHFNVDFVNTEHTVKLIWNVTKYDANIAQKQLKWNYIKIFCNHQPTDRPLLLRI